MAKMGRQTGRKIATSALAGAAALVIVGAAAAVLLPPLWLGVVVFQIHRHLIRRNAPQPI